MATASRSGLVQTLFPDGIPQLWCPPLTHFLPDATLDRDRTAVHLRHIGRDAHGWLVPGSTGEGWQMQDDEVRDVLDHALTVARQVGARVLVGVLRQEAAAAVECIERTTEWICQRAGISDPVQAMTSQHVCGFTVCPPTGEGLSSDDLRPALRSVLQLKLPTALYQLPQVTLNEMSPALVAELADEFPNFFLFKDTSGQDVVARSSVDLHDVYLVRGAEGRYASWLKAADGPYDGFLLSTANVFADPLAKMISQVNRGQVAEAGRMIAPVEQAVQAVFDVVASLPFGNAFTNANKAIDHLMAFGPSAATDTTPILHDGETLPAETIAATREILERAGLLPEQGYLTQA